VPSLPDEPAVAYRTQRLVIRDWVEAEADRMYDMYRRAEVVRFLGSVPTPMPSRDRAVQRIGAHRERNAGWRDAGTPYGWWAVEVAETETVVGTIALLPIDDVAGPEAPVEVAWHLHPDAQGRGYATEAARGAFDRGHAAGIVEVLALTDPANVPSQAVCDRLGLELVETSDRFYGKPLMIWRSRRA
jgi:RimJ/RimL family protein N-acetyltransferase